MLRTDGVVDDDGPEDDEAAEGPEADALGEGAGDEQRRDDGEHHLETSEDRGWNGAGDGVDRGGAVADLLALNLEEEGVGEVADDAADVRPERERVADDVPAAAKRSASANGGDRRVRETHHSVERMQRPDQHCMRMEMLFLLRSSPASKNARPGVILGTARQPARDVMKSGAL